MNSDQAPPEPSYPGGKAAERRREQLAREFGDESPEAAPDRTESDGAGEANTTSEAGEEPDESDEHGSDASGSPEE